MKISVPTDGVPTAIAAVTAWRAGEQDLAMKLLREHDGWETLVAAVGLAAGLLTVIDELDGDLRGMDMTAFMQRVAQGVAVHNERIRNA